MASLLTNDEVQPPRACDRCHALKERCIWLPDETPCERCQRLQHVCETTRPKGRPGRKPAARSSRVSPEHRLRRKGSPSDSRALAHRARSTGRSSSVPRAIPEMGDVPAGDQQLIQQLLFQGELLDTFSVGSSFGDKVRQQVVPHMLLSKPVFLDGLLACAISWLGDVDGRVNPGRLSSCYRYASSAIGTLASLQVTDTKAMADCLTLGALVSTFAVKMRLNDILAICGRTLGLIEPLYTAGDPGQPDLVAFLSCIVVWELRACLLACTVPTLRFRPPAEAYADRHVGLSANLLPLYYDICKLSHALADDETDDAPALEELDAVENSVREWQPAVPADFITRFSTIEVAHMLCQAQVLRLAALLVIHRLRCPFGVDDEPAEILSTAILTQIEMTFAATKVPVRCVDMALLVACLEVKGAAREKWAVDVVTLAGFSSQFGEHMQQTLESFWATMDIFETISWGKLTALGSPFLRNSV